MTAVQLTPARTVVVAVTMALLCTLLGTPAQAAPRSSGCENRANQTHQQLLACVSADSAARHLQAFQRIADAHGGTRASGTPGYDASAEYVAGLMEAAGYEVTRQFFPFPFFEERSEPVLQRVSPEPTTWTVWEDFITMTFSGAGDVTADVEAVDLLLPPGPEANSSTSGCQPGDFAAFAAGAIALVQRGGCALADKALNAQSAGAAGVIVFNEGQPGRTEAFAASLGTLAVSIPVVGTSFEVGQALVEPDTVARLRTDTISEIRETYNVLAETRRGRADNVVMIGAHLDSVTDGPGINDNGSGAAGILDVALKMRKTKVTNTLRFAWWGAEEPGLFGSDHYVFGLSPQERERIALYLNYDIIASPNYARFVYDGDGSTFGTAGPPGSGAIEETYRDFYARRGLASEANPIDFRSDYAAFFDVGIPFGGVFTGADDVKTVEQQAVYGGVAGEPFDPCYERACDTIANVNMEVFDVNVDAIAYTALTYAHRTEAVNGEPGRAVPGSGGGRNK